MYKRGLKTCTLPRVNTHTHTHILSATAFVICTTDTIVYIDAAACIIIRSCLSIINKLPLTLRNTTRLNDRANSSFTFNLISYANNRMFFNDFLIRNPRTEISEQGWTAEPSIKIMANGSFICAINNVICLHYNIVLILNRFDDFIVFVQQHLDVQLEVFCSGHRISILNYYFHTSLLFSCIGNVFE